MTRTDLDHRLTQEPGVRMREPFRVAGYGSRFDRDSKSAIPALWEQLNPRLPLPGQVEAATYGVSWNADLQEGNFNYLAAVEILAGTIPAEHGSEFRVLPRGLPARSAVHGVLLDSCS